MYTKRNTHFVQVAYDKLIAELEKATDEESIEELELLKDAHDSLIYCRSAVSADADCAVVIATQLTRLRDWYRQAYLDGTKGIILAIRKDVCELLVQCSMRIYGGLN